MAADTEAPYDPKDPSATPRFKWVPKAGILPATKDSQGHFRRVNCKVWAAYCEFYKGCGPAIKYVEEPVAVEEETPVAVAKGEPAAARTRAASAAKPESKGNDARAEARVRAASKAEAKLEVLEAKKSGKDPKDDKSSAPATPIIDPLRWQNPAHWIIDQEQDRFLEKFSEKAMPKKSKKERLAAMHDVWNSKKLKGEAAKKAAEEEASKETAPEEANIANGLAPATELEALAEASGEDETKKDDGENQELGVANTNESLQDSMLQKPVSTSTLEGLAAEANPSAQPKASKPSISVKVNRTAQDNRKESIQPGMEDVFARKDSTVQAPNANPMG